MNFSQLYAGTARTLHKSFGFPMNMAEKMEPGFKKAYPGLAVFMERIFNELRDTGVAVYPEFGFVKQLDRPPKWMRFKDPRGYERQHRRRASLLPLRTECPSARKPPPHVMG